MSMWKSPIAYFLKTFLADLSVSRGRQAIDVGALVQLVER
jgi:hypothetical protein